MPSKVITVFGATGVQGGSVVRALLTDTSQYTVRAVTRNAASAKADSLRTQGADVVEADFDKADSVKQAVDGAHGVFLVTNFWEHMSKEKEILQSKTVIDACKATGIKHFVYSGLENVKKITGKDCPHFDGKGEMEEYLKVSGVPYTIVRYAAYLENLLSGMKPFKLENGAFALNIPMEGVPMHFVPASEAGVCVQQVFAQPERFLGQTMGLASDYKTIAEYAQILSNVTGKTVYPGTMRSEEFAKLGFPGAEDLAAMFDFYIRGKPDRSVELTRQLHPNISDFTMFVEKHKKELLDLMQ